MRAIRTERCSFKIEKLVGEGQSAKVYRAIREDSRGHSRQRVALKILKNEKQVSWLRREFETLARVNSSHCVRVMAWENTAEGCALVLEWIEGVSLLELARNCRLSTDIQTEILFQAQEGLKSLEFAGLNHGDLSPSNILIDKTGRVCLVDFATAPAESDFIIGTPAYLAPELWSGRPRSLAADLFALGLIEKDLANHFSLVPTRLDDCRKRAVEIALSTTSEYLHFEGAQRSYRSLLSNEDARRALAMAVQSVLDAKNAFTLKTAALAAHKKLISRWAAALILPALIPFPFGHAIAPEIPLEPAASIKLNSQNWLEAKLNGKPLGFAPIKLNKISAGMHRLEWKTSKASGEIKISVKPGQTLSLTENDLLNQ